MRKSILFLGGAAVLLLLHIQFVHSQTTEFAYQGSLSAAGTPANGSYDFEFLLFDALTAGSQVGATIALNNVVITNGVFSVKLNFGNQFISGANRFMEIRVRPSGQGGITILSPRQLIGSSPYAIRSLGALNAESATMATTALTANNALQLGGVAANQYVLTTDPRMTDARPPTAGSAAYIQNSGAQQGASNFNISGNGMVGGTLSSTVVNAATHYNLGGFRILSGAGTNNIFVGAGAGLANTTGGNNSFFGTQAGVTNTTGGNNALFGTFAGDSNTEGFNNSFFGSNAGQANTMGSNNSFFGILAGGSNTEGRDNSFFGANSGRANTNGISNAFFGQNAGFSNTEGDANSLFGESAGYSITLASFNAFFGYRAGFADTTGHDNVFFGAEAGQANASGNYNAFFGRSAGKSNVLGSENAFFGFQAGYSTTAGQNAFFGSGSGQANTIGSGNSFLGYRAGDSNTEGEGNAFFGRDAGTANTIGNGNSFVGMNAGTGNTTGSLNVFVGRAAGANNASGSNNILIGADSFLNSNNLTFATAIGSGAAALSSNSITLGRSIGADLVRIPGGLVLETLSTGGATSLCRNVFLLVSTCSSSVRYKSNIRDLSSGLDLIRRLRPVSFDWKDSGRPDIGLVAEEVAEIEPLLTTMNETGEVEGVKYDRVGVVLVNAMNEQQAQIEEQKKLLESQQRQIDELKKLVCTSKKKTGPCGQGRK